MPQKPTSQNTVLDYVDKNGSITNRECRELLGISYDHSLKLLGELAANGILLRTGASSTTKYVREPKTKSS